MTNISPDVEDQLKDVGKRLAFLLASSTLPDDVKEAWAIMIPQMSLEQIDRLAKALEGYLEPDAQARLTVLTQQVQQAGVIFEQQKKSAEKQAQKELDEIEAMLLGK